MVQKKYQNCWKADEGLSSRLVDLPITVHRQTICLRFLENENREDTHSLKTSTNVDHGDNSVL
jgi:hypothetical protein